MPRIYIGCSGFDYKVWKNVFYPEKLPHSKWFDHYCTQYNTLELNVTFYKFPTEKSLLKWFNSSPDNFKFSVKAPRLITHYKKFNECESLLHDFYTSIRAGLQEKLGCVLFQLPPQVAYTPEMLDRLLTAVDYSFQSVFEFRHESWWNEEVFTQFKKNRLTFCGVSFPRLTSAVIDSSPDLYYRFHGVPVLYKSLYPENFIQDIYRQIKKINPSQAWI
ncbi:MAG: DUF72 domain-containing protein, partial [Ginsengibacter sp.]